MADVSQGARFSEMLRILIFPAQPHPAVASGVVKHIFQEFVVVVVFFELGLLEEMLFLYDLCHGSQRESFVS